MSEKISVIGQLPKKVQILDQPRRRIDSSVLADSLGAHMLSKDRETSIDVIDLAEMYLQLRGHSL